MQQFRGGKSDYSVRTDDGEAICSYIEEFQKNPEKALVRLREESVVWEGVWVWWIVLKRHWYV